jgi:hypothetical protein
MLWISIFDSQGFMISVQGYDDLVIFDTDITFHIREDLFGEHRCSPLAVGFEEFFSEPLCCRLSQQRQ